MNLIPEAEPAGALSPGEVVTDASVAIAFAVEDEPHHIRAIDLMDNLATQGVMLIAPPLYESEADSAIRRRVHSGTFPPPRLA